MVVIGGMRSFLGPRSARCSSSCSASSCRSGPALAVLVRPAVRRLHRVLADRAGRRRRARCWRRSASGRGRGRRDGGPRGRAASRCRSAAPPLGARRALGLARRSGRASAASARSRHGRRGPRPHAACADRPERRRQDHRLQPGFRPVPARSGRDPARGPADRRASARGHHARGRRPLVPDHQPVRRPDRRGEHAARRAGAHRKRFAVWASTESLAEVNAETAELMHYLGLTGIERAEAASLSYGGQRLLDMGLALATRPRILLLDEPLAGLAAPSASASPRWSRAVSPEIPVLLVEHDIDRVFQIADLVTVMNEGQVLVDGTVEMARNDAKVREIYIGSGAARSPPSRAPRRPADAAARGRQGRHLLRQEPHPQRRLARRARARDRRAARPQRRRQVDAAQDPDRHRAAAAGAIRLAGEDTAPPASAEIARRGIGYVPQGRGLFAGMTVADNLALGRLKRLTGAGIHWDEDRIVEFFPRLAQRWRTPADYLSGGEQQMVAVAARSPATCACSCSTSRSRAFAGGHRGAVRGLRPAAPRDRDGHRRSPPRSRAGAVRPHRGAGARRGHLDRGPRRCSRTISR